MALPLDPDTITNGIRLAVAPVFLLTAVATMIGIVAGRLARIIDRSRVVEEKAQQGLEGPASERLYSELLTLRFRGRLTNACIALLTLCAFMIGLTIILLFLGETTQFQGSRWAVLGFLSGVVCFLTALLCFLIETFIATHMLDFHILNAHEQRGKLKGQTTKPTHTP